MKIKANPCQPRIGGRANPVGNTDALVKSRDLTAL